MFNFYFAHFSKCCSTEGNLSTFPWLTWKTLLRSQIFRFQVKETASWGHSPTQFQSFRFTRRNRFFILTQDPFDSLHKHSRYCIAMTFRQKKIFEKKGKSYCLCRHISCYMYVPHWFLRKWWTIIPDICFWKCQLWLILIWKFISKHLHRDMTFSTNLVRR